MLVAEDLAEAIEILRLQEIAIALVDRDSPNWRFVVARLAARPYRCAVILLSRSATANLWHEFTSLGGYEFGSQTDSPRLSCQGAQRRVEPLA